MEDWTFVDVTDRICIDIISESIDQIQIEDSNSISDDSYYNLNDEIIESENEEIIMQDSINLSTTKSYLQALLSKSQISVDSNLIANEENNKITKVKPSWKPTIIVDRNIKNERKDRLYQHNLTAQSIYTYEDEDDEYGLKVYHDNFYH